MTDLTLPGARADRDRLADRTDVLDKVAALRMLPDDMHVTGEMVATYFEVPVETVKSIVKNNRAEIGSDGYTVASRIEFARSFGDLANLTPQTRSVALFPRRAVLRIGMLLTASPVAQAVRTELLNVEHAASVAAMPDITTALGVMEMAEMFAATARRLVASEAKVAELVPAAEVGNRLLNADGDLSVADAAKVLTRAGVKVGPVRLFKTLFDKGWIFRKASDNRWRVYQRVIETGRMSVIPQTHYHPKTGVLVVDPPQPRVTPKGIQELLAEFGVEPEPEYSPAIGGPRS